MDNDDEKVGYGNPPKATRFKKGRSGNARGRPKGSRNLYPFIEKELNTRIPITENGQARRITKLEAVAKQLVNKSIAGDLRSGALLLKVLEVMEAKNDTGTSTKREYSELHEKILQAMNDRFMNYGSESNEPSST